MTVTAALVIGAGVAATVIDIRQRRVPNVLTMGVASLGLVLAMAGLGGVTLGGALGGLGLGLALLLPAHVFGATGAGDVKLLAAFGALMGPADVFAATTVARTSSSTHCSSVWSHWLPCRRCRRSVPRF